MKHRGYRCAVLLGASSAVLLGCLILYIWGAFPVRRHPYAYPFSVICGGIAAVLCIAALLLLIYYIIKLPRGARVRTIFGSILLTAASGLAGFFLFEFGYEAIAAIVHRLDP